MAVYPFEALDDEIAEFVAAIPFEALDDDIAEFATAIPIEDPSGASLPENEPANSYFAGPSYSGALASTNIYFIPQNYCISNGLVNTTMACNIITTAEAERLRDGTSMVQVSFTDATWVKWVINPVQPATMAVNFISIFNANYNNRFHYAFYDFSDVLIAEGSFTGTNYGAHVFLSPTIYPKYLVVTKPGAGIGSLGEVYCGFYRQPERGYNETYAFIPTAPGEDQSTRFKAIAKDSYYKQRKFDLSFQIKGSTNVDWWEELLYTSRRHKIKDDGHYVTHPICVVINDLAYLVDFPQELTINRLANSSNAAGDEYEMNLMLIGEGIKI